MNPIHSLSNEELGQIHYFISGYRQRHEAYPNVETECWNYVTEDIYLHDSQVDINLNKPNPFEPTFEWKRHCDKYIRDFYTQESFMDYMSTLRDIRISIIPLYKDLSITKPYVYDFTEHGVLPNTYVRVEDSFVVLYPKKELECFNKSFPESPTLEEEEHLSSTNHFKIDFDELDEEILAEKLDKYLRDYEPDFYRNLVEGNGIYFGNYYRNDGYFFFDGKSIVGTVTDVPDTHDYGVPPREIRRFYAFTWSKYEFLID